MTVHSGVVDLATRRRGEPNGVVHLAAGERDSARAWTGWSAPLATATHLAMSGGFERTAGFARSRVTGSEYPGAPRELLPLAGGGERASQLDVRLERDLAAGATLRLAAGSASSAGSVARGELDRQQIVDAAAPWTRLELSTPHRRLRAGWSGYRSRRQRALGLGRERWLDFDRYAVELAGERAAGDATRFAGGLVVEGELAGSRDASGRETWLGGRVHDSLQAAFASAERDLGARLRATLGGRVDRGADGHTRASPRLGLAYGFGAAQTVRLGAGRGFLRPGAERRALALPLREPLDLSPLQDAYGLDLGFDSVPVLALGNPRLRPETVSRVEAGYGGRIGSRVELDVGVHHSRHRDRVSSLLPGVAAAYPRYTVPPGVPPELAALFLATLERFVDPGIRAGLVGRPDGSPAVVQSFANAGAATVRGADVAIRVSIARRWQSALAYSLIDFVPERAAPGDVVVANAPDHRFVVTLAHAGPELRVAAEWRWQPELEWSAAGARGVVPKHSTVDLALSRRLGADWEVGLRATNLLDLRHYETFGGDELRRRVLLTVTRFWR